MSGMPASTLRLVLLISCAHALVHTFELALPAVEQMIGDEYGVGKASTGKLGMVWRLPFGLGAVLAGFLADRYGSRPLLIVYLLGCSLTAVLARWTPSFNLLLLTMLAMGCFASIYHPAGLSLISRETTPDTRGSALGLHGIIGSLGIAGAPFGAMLLFSTGNLGWRDYYLILTIPALLIAVQLLVDELRHRRETRAAALSATSLLVPEEAICWNRYLVLVSAGALSGFVYGAFMHFLPRYLDTAGLRPDGWTPESFRNALAAAVLGFGAIGQGIAGRLCRPGRLEVLLVLVLFGNVPPLLWICRRAEPICRGLRPGGRSFYEPAGLQQPDRSAHPGITSQSGIRIQQHDVLWHRSVRSVLCRTVCGRHRRLRWTGCGGRSGGTVCGILARHPGTAADCRLIPTAVAA